LCSRSLACAVHEQYFVTGFNIEKPQFKRRGFTPASILMPVHILTLLERS